VATSRWFEVSGAGSLGLLWLLLGIGRPELLLDLLVAREGVGLCCRDTRLTTVV
jgi:hypothetical protein